MIKNLKEKLDDFCSGKYGKPVSVNMMAADGVVEFTNKIILEVLEEIANIPPILSPDEILGWVDNKLVQLKKQFK